MLLKLFFLFFKINLLTTSGPASYGFTEKLVVPSLINQQKFQKIVTIASSIPGSDAVQMAWQIGYEVAKFPGAITAVLGALVPCIVLVSLVMFSINLFTPSIVSKFINGIKPVIFFLLIFTAIGLLPPIPKLFTYKTILPLILSAIMLYFKLPLFLTIILVGLISLIL